MFNKIINKCKETMNIIDSTINGTRIISKKTPGNISPIENTNYEDVGLHDCTDIVIRPLYWTNGKLEDGTPVFFTNRNEAVAGCVYESMQGYTEQKHIEASVFNVEELGINVQCTEELINDKKVYVIDYLQSNNAATHQVIYCINNKAYIFTIAEKDQISDVNINGFNSMLNMTLVHI